MAFGVGFERADALELLLQFVAQQLLLLLLSVEPLVVQAL